MTEAVKYIYVGGVQLGTIRIKYDAGQAQYAVLFSTVSTAGINVEHVALYEGEYTEENMPVYRPRGYSIEAAACGVAGMSMELLWENASPTSAFAAQTITLDLTEYKYVRIDFENGTHGRIVNDFPVGYKCCAYRVKLYDTVAFYLFIRDITTTTKTIVFSDATSRYEGTDYKAQVAIDNNSLVPLKIYGIKGVS